jgi:hypothetical protein
MHWQVHYRENDRPGQTGVAVLHDAVTLACGYMKAGLVVEKIQSDKGLTLLGAHVRPLCEQTYRHGPTSVPVSPHGGNAITPT